MPLTWGTTNGSITNNITGSITNTAAWTWWNATSASSSTTVTSSVWPQWCQGGYYSTTTVSGGANWPPTETPAQRHDRECARDARIAAERAANERAEALLRDHLTAEQAAQLIKADGFDLITDSGKRYRVRRGYAGNVYLIEGEHATRRYCIHPDIHVPDADAMLAQKLLLEADEKAFLRIANETVLA